MMINGAGMRKIVVSEFVSLDGVMEEPEWTFPFWNDEIANFKFDELFSGDALLLGRLTYSGFSGVWPLRTDEEGYAERMNSIRKYVVSTSLGKAEWKNTTIVGEHFIDRITELKQEQGRSILLFGSGMLVETLMQHGLVDQFNLLLFPVVLGKGKRLFNEGFPASMRLVSARSFSTGVVALVYEPVKK
jgi:dihydrofolate reductase